jgi:hypothetical protein
MYAAGIDDGRLAAQIAHLDEIIGQAEAARCSARALRADRNLAALAQAQGHRQHTDDHRQGRHEYGAQPSRTGRQGGAAGVGRGANATPLATPLVVAT